VKRLGEKLMEFQNPKPLHFVPGALASV